jgi:hypothetical protein
MRVAIYARVSTEAKRPGGRSVLKSRHCVSGPPLRATTRWPSSSMTATRAPARTGPGSTACATPLRPVSSTPCGACRLTASPGFTPTR